MKHITHYANTQLASLYAQVYERNHLSQIINTLLPAPLKEQVHVCRFEAGELTLGYSQPEAASMLRFYVAKLRTEIRKIHPFHQLASISLKPIRPL